MPPRALEDRPSSDLLPPRATASLPAAAERSGVMASPAQAPPAAVDRLAIASAVCGLTAIIPVVSQGAGLVLGIMAVRRIRRARRIGVHVGGMGWALTGIISSSIALLAWCAVACILAGVLWFFAHASGSLSQIIDAIPATPGP